MHPTLFHIGSIPVRSFGLMVLLGFVLGLIYATSAAKRRLALASNDSSDMSDQSDSSEPNTHHPKPTAERPTPNTQRPTSNAQHPITPDHVFDMAIAALFVAIAGARILYVLLDLNEFRGNWWEVFQVWTGGISI